jgi:hypothetical protein
MLREIKGYLSDHQHFYVAEVPRLNLISCERDLETTLKAIHKKLDQIIGEEPLLYSLALDDKDSFTICCRSSELLNQVILRQIVLSLNCSDA